MSTFIKFIIFNIGLLPLCFAAPFASAQISTPQDVGNLVFWVDASDVNGTGIQPANGDVITSWADKSGGGHNLTTSAGTVTFEATGFDGINPSLRLPLSADMDAPNPFSGDFQNELTVFFVAANVTFQRGVSLSLNGHNRSDDPADGRFSFHTPWTTNDAFFDAGSSLAQHRLFGPFPNALTETTLFTGLNDANGSSQLFRIDGQAFGSDTTAVSANVSRGIHIGTLSNGLMYDGRFAEILIYDRALTTAEIADVECFLLLKWKLSAAPSGCSVNVSAAQAVEVWDPTMSGKYAIPGNDVIYTITATHESGPALDVESFFLSNQMSSDVLFYNGDIDDGGPETHPVSFTENGSGLTFDYTSDVGFSNLGVKPSVMTDCTYTPLTGYDPAVTYICIQPTGAFQSGTPDPSFSISFRAQIQ